MTTVQPRARCGQTCCGDRGHHGSFRAPDPISTRPAAASRLSSDKVKAACRAEARFPPDLREAGVRFIRSDRYAAKDLRNLLREGADVVVDCVTYSADHARMLLPFRDDIGSLILISSKAVYVDERGHHSNSVEPPVFSVPVTEEQATMTSSDIDYNSPEGYGANKIAAEHVAIDSGMAVSVLRPLRIHGVGAARPGEWVFVKRVLDGRPHLLLARDGRGINHPTAAVNLAALVEFCASRPGTRILNCADPDAPDGLTISRIIAARLGHTWNEVLLDAGAPEGLGDHPWNTLPPFVLDTSAAKWLGFVPVGTYADTVGPEVEWLATAQRRGDPTGILPAPDDSFFAHYFDYDREDAWLSH